MTGTRPSGQPRETYDFPKKTSDYIRKKLGSAEGLITFMHKLSFVEDVQDMTEMILEYDKQGLLRNLLTGQQVKTKLPERNVAICRFIWKERGYLVTFYKEHQSGALEETGHEYWAVTPPYKPSKHLTIERLPSLRAMKPKDETTSQEYLIRIGQPVPVALAYKNEDPIQLSKVGMMQYEWKGKIYDMFEIAEDIENSPDWTKTVGRNYYDNTTTTLYDTWYESAKAIRVLASQIANEIDGINFSGEEEGQSPIKKEGYRDVSVLE